jgi:hypothetical protein
VSDALIVFVKEPRPGAVKTRLARSIGDHAAAAAYRALAEAEIRATAPPRATSGGPAYERLFFFAPAEAEAAVADWLRGVLADEPLVCRPQSGADLGARMAGAFDECFARGARRVAIVGTDVPACSSRHVLAALGALDDHDVALGPTHDGGYYLLALERPRPELFRDISWSTPAVLAATRARAAALGLRVELLETLRDVDTLEDWDAYRAGARPG